MPGSYLRSLAFYLFLCSVSNPSLKALSDKELMIRFQEPSQRNAVFLVIVERYQNRIYWQVRKLVLDHEDANDIVQNVFVKAWKNLAGFRQEAELFTWLYRIASNESFNFIKQKKARLGISIDEHGESIVQQLVSDPLFTGEEIHAKLMQAVETLPDKQKQVFNLKYFEDMKYEDMSALLETSVGALKASYHHAVKKIEQLLTQH
jgi:RNA polymerase sigma-70 factor (ECF subfamily)